MSKRACIFIDGENLRHSLDALFDEFLRSTHYLPYADWESMFEAIRVLALRKTSQELNLIRTYWYVIGEIQYNDFFKTKEFRNLSITEKIKCFERYAKSFSKKLKSNKTELLEECLNLLNKNSGIIDSQQKFWRDTESKIQIRTNKLQFQRFGYLKADLDDGKGKIRFKNEKGTDVKLATDLIIFKDIYDVAIIVSGDGDYIPAIAAIKNMGKQVIVVDFKSKLGKLLPGGAKRLKEHCDFSFSLNYNTMYDICRYGLSKKDPSKKLDLISDYNF